MNCEGEADVELHVYHLHVIVLCLLANYSASVSPDQSPGSMRSINPVVSSTFTIFVLNVKYMKGGKQHR